MKATTGANDGSQRSATVSPVEGSEPWMTADTLDLARAIAALRDEDEAMRFLRDLCTVRELVEFGHRWQVARLLDAGIPYHEISDRTGASSATISRVNQWLRYGRGGYRLLLDRDAGPAPTGGRKTQTRTAAP
jgi:TrpR-related protein YerC/YecD